MPMLGALPRLRYDQTNIGAMQNFGQSMQGLGQDAMVYGQQKRMLASLEADNKVQGALLSLAKEMPEDPAETRSALLKIVGDHPGSRLGQKLGISVLEEMMQDRQDEGYGTPPWHQNPKFSGTPAAKIAAGKKARAGMIRRLTPEPKEQAEIARKEKRLDAKIKSLMFKLARADKEADYERPRAVSRNKDKVTANDRLAAQGEYSKHAANAKALTEQIETLERERAALHGEPRAGTPEKAQPTEEPKPIPADPNELVAGQVYVNPQGVKARWNGATYEVLQ